MITDERFPIKTETSLDPHHIKSRKRLPIYVLVLVKNESLLAILQSVSAESCFHFAASYHCKPISDAY